MAAEVYRHCEIYQVGDLLKCGVYITIDGDEQTFGVVFCDKVVIKYNLRMKMFVVAFAFGKKKNEEIRLVECNVHKIYVHDLVDKDRITLPSYDAEWPYDDIRLEMKEE